MQPGGGDRIDRGQPLVEPAAAVAAGVVGQPAAQLPIGRRPLKDSPQQPLQIERRSADEEHLPSAAGDFRRDLARRLDVLGQAEFLAGVEHVDQVMRYLAAIVGRRFGRADVHPPIEGDRVERDDFGPDPTRQFHADRRLARRRRAGEKPAVTRRTWQPCRDFEGTKLGVRPVTVSRRRTYLRGQPTEMGLGRTSARVWYTDVPAKGDTPAMVLLEEFSSLPHRTSVRGKGATASRWPRHRRRCPEDYRSMILTTCVLGDCRPRGGGLSRRELLFPSERFCRGRCRSIARGRRR